MHLVKIKKKKHYWIPASNWGTIGEQGWQSLFDSQSPHLVEHSCYYIMIRFPTRTCLLRQKNLPSGVERRLNRVVNEKRRLPEDIRL